MRDRRTWSACALLLLAACSGGGGSGSATPTPAAAPALEMLAGFPPTAGASLDGTGMDARFRGPTGIVADPAGVLYVADSQAFAIRRITDAGVVTTFAGTLGASGFADGVGAAARFGGPSGFDQGIGGLAMDGAGNIYVADRGNNRIRKITPQGVVTTLAGGDSAGYADGIGSDARFDLPWTIAVDAPGNVYVGEQFKPRIRKITPSGLVTTIAGDAQPGMVDGPASSARFGRISGLATDSSGNLYIADGDNYAIRKLGTDGNVITLRGGIGSNDALFVGAIAVDAAGALYVTGGGIQKILPSGAITWLGGFGASIQGVAVGKDGRVYYSEASLNAVYQITAAGGVSLLAGAAFGPQAQVDGVGANARFEYLISMAANSAGDLHVIDSGSIRKVTRGGAVTTRLSGLGNFGIAGLAVDDADSTYYSLWAYCGLSPHLGCETHSFIEKVSPDGQRVSIVPAGSSDGTHLPFYRIMGITRDRAGNLLLSHTSEERILNLGVGGDVTTIAGGPSAGHVDGIGTAARFTMPTALALDRAGNLFVADTRNHSIRKIAPDRSVTTLVAGPNLAGAVNGGLQLPSGVAVDDSGNVYVADTGNHVVRKVAPSGAMSIVAGQLGRAGFASGPLPGVLESPVAVAVVGTDLYIAMPSGIAVVRNRP